jgi:hypothetical protein
MKHALICILLFCLSYSGICQVKNVAYYDSCALVKKALGNGRKNVNIFSGISPYVLDAIQASIKKGKFIRKLTSDSGIVVEDSIVLSSIEIADLVKQINLLQSFRWTEQTTECLGLRLFSLKFDTVNNRSESGQAYQIVPPIYFRNGEYCLFYYDYQCGPLCGHGELQIIKVTQNSFDRWWTVFAWDS